MKLTDTMVDIVKMMMFQLSYFRYMKLTDTMVDIVKMMMFQLFTLFISDI